MALFLMQAEVIYTRCLGKLNNGQKAEPGGFFRVEKRGGNGMATKSVLKNVDIRVWSSALAFVCAF